MRRFSSLSSFEHSDSTIQHFIMIGQYFHDKSCLEMALYRTSLTEVKFSSSVSRINIVLSFNENEFQSGEWTTPYRRFRTFKKKENSDF